MKSVSIYTLTRNQNISCVQKLERQMSGRGYFLKMREWELDSMKAFVRELETHMDEVYALWFFYSFQIPRLGKEFDLLQIREDQIVNVELKSGAVSDEALRKQLLHIALIVLSDIPQIRAELFPVRVHDPVVVRKADKPVLAARSLRSRDR